MHKIQFIINPKCAVGGVVDSACTFFRQLFLHEKSGQEAGGLFVDFSLFIRNFQKKRKVIFGDLN